MENDLNNICIRISGNRRNKILYNISNHVTIVDILAHRCFVDPNFIEIQKDLGYGYYIINSARYNKYHDLKRYNFKKFIKCTKDVFPIYVIIRPTTMLLTYLKLKGLYINKENIYKIIREFNLKNLIYDTEIRNDSNSYIYNEYIKNKLIVSITEYDTFKKFQNLINKI